MRGGIRRRARSNHRWLVSVVAAAALFGCGHGKDPETKPKDDASTPNADAAPSLGTDVSGIFRGTPFRLQYAAIDRSNGFLIWVCVADRMVTYAECQTPGEPERLMFLGPFGYDNELAKWSIPQVGLFRVGGTNPSSDQADSGTITVHQDDPVTGDLQISFSVDFGEAQPTTGTVSVQH